jgi:uncharacterized protein (TIGR02266 family)
MQDSARCYDERSTLDTVPVPAGNRRIQARYELTLAITMQGENNFYTGLSENISEGGVFIATSHLLELGTPVVLEFTLPTSDEPLKLYGTVQWVRGPDATAKRGELFGGGGEVYGAMPGLGVQFQRVGPDAARAIRAFMDQRAPVFFDA